LTGQKVVVGYKFVTSELKSKEGDCTWKVGEWQKCAGTLEICQNGLHACESPLDSLNYVYGNRWFQVEARGEILRSTDKFAAREMRLIRELPVTATLVPFAIACAKRCYKHWKAKYPEDKRIIEAIHAAEKCLKNPTEENKSAAWSAAGLAESAARSAGSAARSAAGSAAGLAESAARSAAGSAAGLAESAARSAAGSAARSAARSAAGSAARSAARSAAWSADRQWQSRTLNRLLRNAERK
jgi:hypothetical protein